MTKLDIATRCWLLGLVAGAITGAVTGTLILPVVGTVVGAIVGAFIGFVTGAVESAVVVPLVRTGAALPVVRLAAAGTAMVVMAPLAGGWADFDGWVLVAIVSATGVLAAALAPVAVAPGRPTRSNPASRIVAWSVAIFGGLGVLSGAIVGLYVNRGTAWFAAIEVGLAGVVAGVLVAGLVLVVRTAGRRRCGRHEAPAHILTR